MGLFPRKNYVGIDLGHFTIKVLQLEKQGDIWRVARFGVVPTPPDSIKDGVVVDMEAVAWALKDALKDAHIHASSAHIAVAGASVFVRPVKMPKMPEIALRKSIKFEASRFVPGSAEDSYIDFEILGDADDAQMDVLMVAAPKEIVESRIRAVEAAGLEVESVEVEGFSMYRSLIETDKSNPWSESTIALVDVGALTTNLSVISNGQFMMTRSIPHGGNMLTEALKNYFKLETADAEAGKAQLDLRELLDAALPRENPPLRVLQPHVDELIREIRRSLNYYQSQQGESNQAGQVDAVIVTGGGAKLSGFADYVASKLSMRVEAAGVLACPQFMGTGETTDDGADLAVASGLALRAFTKAA